MIASVFGFKIAKLYSKFYPDKKKVLRSWYDKATEASSLFFMDGPCLSSTKYFLDLSKDTEDVFLPIPCLCDASIYWQPENDGGNTIRLCYFGRVEDFKTGPLLGILNDINSLVKKRECDVKFTIIGDGRDLQKVRLFVDKKINFPVEFKGKMSNFSARKWICENTDTLFAMGTAALDGASAGVPTILINPSSYNLNLFTLKSLVFNRSMSVRQKVLSLIRKATATSKVMKVNEIYNQKQFSLGDYEERPHFQGSGKRVDELLSSIMMNPVGFSEKCREYVLKMHSIEKVCSKLVRSASIANYKVSQIPEVWLNNTRLDATN